MLRSVVGECIMYMMQEILDEKEERVGRESREECSGCV